MEVPASTKFNTSTTCWRLPSGSAETVVASLRIHLNLLEWLAQLSWLAYALGWIKDEAKPTQDLPDGPCRVWHDNSLSLQITIAPEIVENGTRARDALQVFGWSGADLNDPLH